MMADVFPCLVLVL